MSAKAHEKCEVRSANVEVEVLIHCFSCPLTATPEEADRDAWSYYLNDVTDTELWHCPACLARGKRQFLGWLASGHDWARFAAMLDPLELNEFSEPDSSLAMRNS